MFLDHARWRSTVGRTPLDKWSARRRDLYLTTHDTHNRQISMPPVGVEPTISAGERPVFKRQVINLRNCCIWLVDSFECIMTHGFANTKSENCYWLLILNGVSIILHFPAIGIFFVITVFLRNLKILLRPVHYGTAHWTSFSFSSVCAFKNLHTVESLFGITF